MRAGGRTILTVLLIAAGTGAFVKPAVAGSQTDANQRAAEKAARQITDARRQADAAAQGYADAQVAAAEADDGLTRIEAQLEEVSKQADALRKSVEQLAVLRYVQAGATDTAFLILGPGIGDQLQADQYAAIALRASAEDVDTYEANLQDLGRLRDAVTAARKKSERAARTLNARHKKLEQRIVQLQKAEQKRLRDVAVRKALEAQRRAELARIRAANAAAAAAAAARAGPDIGVRATPGTYDGNLAGYGHDYGGPGFLCPVAGPSTFVDTWGAPRSGGRRHQGVDMLSARGTPAVAVVSGVTRMSRNRLGGNALWLDGDDGNSYYYAHFDRYGKIGVVKAGDIVGYVGDTGDARGTPHLHFEVHPGRGAAVNPYPTARSHC